MKVSRYFDSNALKTLTNAGNDTVIEYIKMYLEQTSLEINQLQKLDVLNDWKHISLIAHNLKSKAKYMGVSQLAMIAEELEIQSNGNNKTRLPKLIIEFKTSFADVQKEMSQEQLRLEQQQK